jgi:hypothetical protein
VLLLAGCKKEAAAPAPKPAPPPRALGHLPAPRAEKAEVEVGGTWSPGSTHPKKVYVAVMESPCLPVPAEPKMLAHDIPTNERFFMEIFVPQGTKGFICLYGLDEMGKVTSAGAWEKNPFLMQGEGEVVPPNVTVTLEPVAPVAPPKGLLDLPGR